MRNRSLDFDKYSVVKAVVLLAEKAKLRCMTTESLSLTNALKTEASRKNRRSAGGGEAEPHPPSRRRLLATCPPRWR
jgi:spore coat protein U-like protein